MDISIIVACDLNGVIGKNGSIPWHLSADLRLFKKLTDGNTVIMGRKTFDSIGKPLPNRTNIVITHNHKFTHQDVITASGIQNATEIARKIKNQDVFIIGGSRIYEQYLPMATYLYLTRVNTKIIGGDSFFFYQPEEWGKVLYQDYKADKNNTFDFRFELLKRIK